MKLHLMTGILACSIAASAAQAAVDVKPGLWEFTTKMDPKEFQAVQKESIGNMQEAMEKAMAEAKAKMSPEQLKQMEALMAEHSAPTAKPSVKHDMPGMSASAKDSLNQLGTYMQTGQMTVKSCVTQKDIDTAKLTREEKSGSCVSKVSQLSSSQFKSITDCSGPDKTHTEADVVIQNPKAFNAKFVSSMSLNGKPTTMHGEQSAKWVDSDCGEYAKEVDDEDEADAVPK